MIVSYQTIGQNLTQKANLFLNGLSPELKSRTLFKLEGNERFNMNYVPIARKGPTFHDFDQSNKQAALNLLKASISEEGYRKTNEIMELEKVLIIIEQNRFKMPDGSDMRDPLNYHFCIFGTPSAEGYWGWRFEGHHISLNFTINRGQIVSATPSFFGSNPGIVKVKEQNGKEVLKKETDLGFQLINMLSQKQLKIARFSDSAPREILTGNDRKATNLEPKGISYDELDEPQQTVLLKLLKIYVDNYEFGFSSVLFQKIIDAGFENLFFAWAGSLTKGKGHYYRIQGPMLLIEYDNIQNNANHVHTVVRDLTNDFAEDLLYAHYKNEHKN